MLLCDGIFIFLFQEFSKQLLLPYFILFWPTYPRSVSGQQLIIRQVKSRCEDIWLQQRHKFCSNDFKCNGAFLNSCKLSLVDFVIVVQDFVCSIPPLFVRISNERCESSTLWHHTGNLLIPKSKRNQFWTLHHLQPTDIKSSQVDIFFTTVIQNNVRPPRCALTTDSFSPNNSDLVKLFRVRSYCTRNLQIVRSCFWPMWCSSKKQNGRCSRKK